MRKFINKILFIGLGGAGQRHLRIFRSLLPNTEFFAFRKINQTPTLNSDFTVNKKEKLEEMIDTKLELHTKTTLMPLNLQLSGHEIGGDDIKGQVSVLIQVTKFFFSFKICFIESFLV